MTGPVGFWPIPPDVATPWPTTVLWRWRYEIAAGAAALLAYHAGSIAPHLLLATAVPAVGLASVPTVRDYLLARLWCVLTQHRLRTGLAKAWVHDRNGRLPAIIWTSRTAAGERVLLWCPAGVTFRHVRNAADVLRAACWARGVEVSERGDRGHLVTVHVIRRSPPEAPPAARAA